MARSRVRRRGVRGRKTSPTPLADKPFRGLRNPMPPVEILSQEQLAKIHDASMRILEDVGIDFLNKEALDLWATAGAKVDYRKSHVWLDRGLVMDLIAKSPSEFTLHARNPNHNITIGGNHINFVTVGAAPYYSDLERGRKPGTLQDYRRMVKLTQQCGPLHVVEGLMVEPQDIPVAQRHVEKSFALQTLTDKTYTTAAHGPIAATDYLKMAAIVHGGMENIRRRPVFVSNVNANSPLRFDDYMLGAMMVYARHGQPNIITPFILAGAMSPVTMAAAITQQNAEALAGIALTQLVNPGCPVVYGGFTTNVDMRNGSPAFGTPEGALALLGGAQLARHYGLPYRGSGGLNNSKLPDAQAAYETQMSLWPAVLAHANFIMHSAGWLEAGLVCSLEKFILDVEGLAMFHHFLAGFEISDQTLALETIADVGPGGHHFGTAHTMNHYKTAFYQPIVSDRNNYDNWQDKGGIDAAQRAHQVAKQLLDAYKPPPIDECILEELQAYVERRRNEEIELATGS